MLKIHKVTTTSQSYNSGPSLYPKGYSYKSPIDKDTSEKIKEISEQFKKSSSQSDTSSDSMLSGILGNVGSISNATSKLNETVNPTTLSIRNSISDLALKSGDPTLMTIGAITKGLDAIGDSTGLHIDDMDKETAKTASVGKVSRFLNNAFNVIPGASTLAGLVAPKIIDNATLTAESATAIPSYLGIQSKLDAASNLSGNRYVVDSDQLNGFVRNTNWKVSALDRFGSTNTFAKKSDYTNDLVQQSLNRYAGTNYQTYAYGKNGMKIMSRKELQAILNIKKLQKGGVIGQDTNILPEGALHARLNHLDEVNPELAENITKKGIPVLDENGQQVAEIERNELILTKALTDKIEELMKDGSEDAMIEAGKILTDELINNTQDNTGQITEET